MSKTYIVHIQRMQLHDGHGIRSTVFVKGCPLRCSWCCNPECQGVGPELRFEPKRCLGAAECGLCITACPRKCLSMDESGVIQLDRLQCSACGVCADICPSKSLLLMGRFMSIAEIFSELEKDRLYYELSGGGVTLSGGEPLTRQYFTSEFTLEAKARHLDCEIQTSGYFDIDNELVRESLSRTSRLSFDIRHVDSSIHRAFTGVDTARIVENLIRLGKEFPQLPIVAHTLVVPGFNDDPSVINGIMRLVSHHPTVKSYSLIPLHSYGQKKYEQLGKDIPFLNLQGWDSKKFEILKDIVASQRNGLCMSRENEHVDK